MVQLVRERGAKQLRHVSLSSLGCMHFKQVPIACEGPCTITDPLTTSPKRNVYPILTFFNSIFPVWTQFNTSVKRLDTSFPTVILAITFFTASTFVLRSVEWSSMRSSWSSPFFWVVKKRESDPPSFFNPGMLGNLFFGIFFVFSFFWRGFVWVMKTNSTVNEKSNEKQLFNGLRQSEGKISAPLLSSGDVSTYYY